jgi:hypothetical protein
MAEDLINLTPGTTPPSPNIHAIIGSGDPGSAAGDTDITSAPIGSLFIRRDGIPGTFLYKKTSSSPNTWQVNDRLFDVRVYGAVGNGTTDDSGAFIKAITAAQAVNGIVYVPPPPVITNSYLISAALTFPSNTSLHLAGGVTLTCSPPSGTTSAIVLGSGCTIRGQSAAGSTILCTTSATNAIQIGGTAPGHSCLITDVTVSGVTTGNVPTGNFGIMSTTSPVEVIIQRCVVNGFVNNAIDSGSNAARWRISETVIHGTAASGINVAFASTGFIITNNHISNVGLVGIALQGNSNVVNNNWLQNTATNGSYGISLSAVATVGSTPGTDCRYCVVSGNRITGFKDSGLGIFPGPPQNTSDNLITGNVVTGSGGFGIQLHVGLTNGAFLDRNAIVGNIFNSNGATGVLVYGYNAASLAAMLIANNSITQNAVGVSGQNGIQIQGPSALADMQILHNVVVLNADSSEANQISVIAATRATVAGNKTESADNTYKIINTTNTTVPTLVVNNTAGGASIVDLVTKTGVTGSAYQINGTPV